MTLEVIVFASAEHARYAGFRAPKWTHVQDPEIKAWWPDRDLDYLRGTSLERVTVSDDARRSCYGADNQAKMRALEEGLFMLRTRLRLGKAVWIEL